MPSLLWEIVPTKFMVVCECLNSTIPGGLRRVPGGVTGQCNASFLVVQYMHGNDQSSGNWQDIRKIVSSCGWPIFQKEGQQRSLRSPCAKPLLNGLLS